MVHDQKSLDMRNISHEYSMNGKQSAETKRVGEDWKKDTRGLGEWVRHYPHHVPLASRTLCARIDDSDLKGCHFFWLVWSSIVAVNGTEDVPGGYGCD